MAERQQARPKARAAKRPEKPPVDLKDEIAGLKRDLRERTAELAHALERQNATARDLQESLEYQTATSAVLEVISRSTFDLQTVLDQVAETAGRLCAADMGHLATRIGESCRPVATFAYPPEHDAWVRSLRLTPGRGSVVGRAMLERAVVHVADLDADAEYALQGELTIGRPRTALGVPLLRDGEPIGVIFLARQRAEPFTERQIKLVRSFADQAVIAIENTRLLTETREALERQTATAEVLQVINSSPGDLAPVFDAMLEKAMRLCDATMGALGIWHENRFGFVAQRGTRPQSLIEYEASNEVSLGSREGFSRVARGEGFVQFTDVSTSKFYKSGDPYTRALVDRGGARATLCVPLVKDDTVLGVLAFFRQEVKPFTDKQIALVKNFAAQAVIAMENARLLGELRQRTGDLQESLEYQTATGDVLKIISRSSVDLETVLDTLVETAARLCRADQSHMFRRRDELFHMIAAHGLSEEAETFFRTHPFTQDRGTVSGRVALERRAVHIPDALQDPEYAYREGLKIVGARTLLGIPLLREEALIGIFVVSRNRVEPFTDKEIELVTTFADQAVIAIENARLFDELRDRQAELARSVDELTATSDVLKTISRSSVDLETVLDALVETAARLCRADLASMFRRRDDRYQLLAVRGFAEEARAFFRIHPIGTGRGSLSGRVELERRAVHIPDVLQDSEYTYHELQKIIGFRTMLGIPLLREEALIGILHFNRTRVDPFTEKEIELATTFADQAVIAIENARLFDELRERQAELRVTFDNMGDGVAMFDGQQRLVAWNSNFQQILDMPDALLARRLTYADYLRILAERGEFGTEDIEAELSRRLQDTERDLRLERTRPDGRVIEVRRNPVPGGGFVLIYADITERKRAEAAIRIARDAAEAALRELQTTQASLVHAQKMAALGQLTAGIAHEIKNPLNFVNNFAGISVELLDELKEATGHAIGALAADKRAEIAETIGMLTSNLEKIAEHGRRADGIVKSMLQHSRGGSGDWRATDLNALVEEALNLAYHGARAQDQSFNITMERDLDRDLAPIEVVPQEVTRVFLNLIGNGFYAASKRSRAGDGAFHPVLKVTTRECGDTVEVRVRDNGVGIAAEHREKLFQPFFTTKPTGEGTGLGLSISYEIVTQQHGGTISVDSEVDCFTEFTVRLPRRRHEPMGKTA
jgi:PAS domain S-box-containing protein